MTHDKKLEKLEKLLNLVDESLTRSEFVEAFEGIIAAISDLKKMNQEHLKHLADVADDLKEKLKSNNTTEVSALKNELVSEIKKALKEQENGMNFIRDKVRKIKEGKDGYTPVKGKDYFDGEKGKDADEEKILEEIKKDLPKLGATIRDGLELLQNGDKLSIQAIQDLSAILEELKNKPTGKGGVSLISKRIRFIDDETPTGAIDGLNAIFTISKSPEKGSLKVYVNGARMRVTEDYTLSAGDKTITFVTAPPTGSIIFCDFRY